MINARVLIAFCVLLLAVLSRAGAADKMDWTKEDLKKIDAFTTKAAALAKGLTDVGVWGGKEHQREYEAYNRIPLKDSIKASVIDSEGRFTGAKRDVSGAEWRYAMALTRTHDTYLAYEALERDIVTADKKFEAGLKRIRDELTGGTPLTNERKALLENGEKVLIGSRASHAITLARLRPAKAKIKTLVDAEGRDQLIHVQKVINGIRDANLPKKEADKLKDTSTAEKR